MPQLSSGGGDDLGANDEMIAFKDEGEQEEKIQENAFTERDLADLKSSLVNETEINQGPGAAAARRGQQAEPRGHYVEKHREHLNGVPKQQDGGMYKTSYQGYPLFMLPDPYQSSSMPPSPTATSEARGLVGNVIRTGGGGISVVVDDAAQLWVCCRGLTGWPGVGVGGHHYNQVMSGTPLTQATKAEDSCSNMELIKENNMLINQSAFQSNKVSVVQQPHGMHPLSSLLPYGPNDHFSPSPPHLPTDMSQKTGVHRPQSQDLSGFYSLPPGSVGQISPSMGWQGQPVYPGLPSCGFRQTYSSNLPASSSSYPRFPHSLMLGPSGMHPTGIPHPAIVPPTGKQEHDHYDRGMYAKPHGEAKREKEPKKPVIKKPLNAFMLYMKEMRAKVIAECTLKESAAINQILGRRWHALTRDEQAKYYELARKERQLHMQLYPSWSARDNYEAGRSGGAGGNTKDWGKKKRRKREKQQDSNTDPGSPKKCRARFGLNQQTDWCGPCRRKKKCIRYLQGGGCPPSPASSDGSPIDSPPPSPYSSPARPPPQRSPARSPPLPPSPLAKRPPYARARSDPTASSVARCPPANHARTELSTAKRSHAHANLHSSPAAVAKATGLSLRVLTESQM
ncbi:Transcription factor 7-like 2 [Merluccius polli]|uniref:Transcription factor 7-like 2 n=1 Tax=Merluccius polli TaxID=89951 RepID=A0AA47NA14_MERPO|nr:Transcription factor 7-like 2 [Merluccius polli]